MENNIKRQPKTNLCCLFIFHDVVTLVSEMVFLSKVSFLDFAIRDCTVAYKNSGRYMIKPIIIAVIAAKKTEPAAMSFIKPILS